MAKHGGSHRAVLSQGGQWPTALSAGDHAAYSLHAIVLFREPLVPRTQKMGASEYQRLGRSGCHPLSQLVIQKVFFLAKLFNPLLRFALLWQSLWVQMTIPFSICPTRSSTSVTVTSGSAGRLLPNERAGRSSQSLAFWAFPSNSRVAKNSF